MGQIAVICSEFNKELVESLYDQASKEFIKYKNKAGEGIGSFQNFKLSLNELKDSQVLEFIKGKSELKKFIDQNKQASQFLKPFVDEIINAYLEPFWLPGAGEIPLTAKWLMESNQVHAILALGVIIRGQTTHYDFLCNFLEKALWNLQKTYLLPIIFSVLMVENKQQAEERIKKGRGADGMKSLLQMMELNYFIKQNKQLQT